MHQTQSAARKQHHLAEHQAIRDLRESDPFDRPKAPPNRLALTPEEAAYDRFQMGVSLRATHRLVELALLRMCAEHYAERGEYCWPHARGICQGRLERGKQPGPHPEPNPRITVVPVMQVLVDRPKTGSRR